VPIAVHAWRASCGEPGVIGLGSLESGAGLITMRTVGLPEKVNTKPSNKKPILVGLQAFR